MNIQRVQKLITFSPQLYDLIERKAQKIGISFPEYIRGLAVNDIKKSVEAIDFLTMEEEEGVRRSLADIKEGRYTIVKSDEDIEKHFKSLSS